MSSNDRVILEQFVTQGHAQRAPNLSKSQFFEIFAAEQVLKDNDLSYEELESGLVAGGLDGGIDAVFTFVNGELAREDSDFSMLKKGIVIDVYVLQAKTSPSFEESPIDRLQASSLDLFNLSKELSEFSTVYNESLRSAFSVFRKIYKDLALKLPDLRVTYVYATTATQLHPNVQRKANLLCAKIREVFSSSEVNFIFLGASELLSLVRRIPSTTYHLSLAENPISSAGEVGYVCLVKLRDYFNFLSDETGKLRKSLFEANVRDYQGNVQVNEGIQASLRQHDTEDFWWLNNGITILATKATQSGKSLTLEDPQIVNGLQTSSEIYGYFREANTENEARNLLVRVIVPTEAESRDRVIKATNSQTAIPAASLRATDKIHRDIEEYLKPFDFYYDRRKNFYKNEGRPADKIISISLMAQSVMSIVLGRPNDARARPSSLLKRDDDYSKLFAAEYPLSLYRTCISIVKSVDAYLREKTELDAKEKNNVRFYVAMVLTALLCRSFPPRASDVTAIALDNINEELLTDAFSEVQNTYLELGGNDQVAKGTDLLIHLVVYLQRKLGTGHL